MENKDILSCFDSELGRELFASAIRCIEDNGMWEKLRCGVLLGFSGGADSVFGALLLLKIKREYFDFPLVLCHIHHGIREKSATADMHFCEKFANENSIEIITRKLNVPAIAEERHIGIEECARELRYLNFDKIISGRNDVQTIVTAHNATDNLETVLQRLMRGTGTRGLSGIQSVRGNIIRPMLYLPKRDIVNFLSSSGIAFVTDESNAATEYTRNFIRCEILPLFERLTPSPEVSIMRFVQNLREDEECLSRLASDFLLKYPDGMIDSTAFMTLPNALKYRVLSLMFSKVSGAGMLERRHFDIILNGLHEARTKVSLPFDLTFHKEQGKIYIKAKTLPLDEYTLKLNETKEIASLSLTVCFCDENGAKSFLNVYKNSISQPISSAIIVGDVSVRTKKSGDTYRLLGMRRKLKTLFQSRHLTTFQKERIPVFCDESGILFVPSFGVRDFEKTHRTEKNYYLLMHYPDGVMAPWENQ